MVLMDYFICWYVLIKNKHIFSVSKHLFSSWFTFHKNYAYPHISKIEKGAHLNFAMGPILHKYATVYSS